MNHMEELEMKWEASKIVFMLPIIIMTLFSVLTVVLFVPMTFQLHNDCNSYLIDWKIDACNQVKNTAITIPLIDFSVLGFIIVFREVIKRTYYRKLFMKNGSES